MAVSCDDRALTISRMTVSSWFVDVSDAGGLGVGLAEGHVHDLNTVRVTNCLT